MYFNQWPLITAILLSALSTVHAAPQQATTAVTQTGAASPQQTAEFLAALKSYYSSFLGSPAATSLGINLALNIPASELQSVTANLENQIPVPTTAFDLKSFATNPPLTFTSTPAWLTAAGTNVEQQVQALETSVVLKAAEIAQSVIGTNVALSVPTDGAEASGNGAAGGHAGGEVRWGGKAIGAAAFAIGAAAVML